MKILPFMALCFSGLLLAGCNANRVQVINGGSEALFTKNVTAARDQTVKVNFWTAINPDCTEVPGAIARIDTPAQHGTASVTRVNDFAFFPANNPRSACNTHRVGGWAITYRAAPDYTGEDSFVYSSFAPNGAAYHGNILVHVQ